MPPLKRRVSENSKSWRCISRWFPATGLRRGRQWTNEKLKLREVVQVLTGAESPAYRCFLIDNGLTSLMENIVSQSTTWFSQPLHGVWFGPEFQPVPQGLRGVWLVTSWVEGYLLCWDLRLRSVPAPWSLWILPHWGSELVLPSWLQHNLHPLPPPDTGPEGCASCLLCFGIFLSWKAVTFFSAVFGLALRAPLPLFTCCL